VLALQVPKAELTKGSEKTVGIWTTASRRRVEITSTTGAKKSAGGFVQVSRLGNPLVNEVVIPVGKKDRFNASKPTGDTQFLPHVTNPELPKLIEAIYGIPAPPTPRNDLVSVFLTGVTGLNKPANVRPSELLRLNTSIAPSAAPRRLGVLEGDTAGFPNGRRLTDDVVDIAIQVMEGELVGRPNDLGDLVDDNDEEFGGSFPYVALPHSGSETSPVGDREVNLSSSAREGGSSTSDAAVITIAGLVMVGTGLVTRRRSARI
jgi:hypothetical protein